MLLRGVVIGVVFVAACTSGSSGEPETSPSTDLRTGPGAVAADLDGDGHADQLWTESGRGVFARLATGRTTRLSDVDLGGPDGVLAVVDFDGDGRDDALIAAGGETWSLAALVSLVGDDLRAIPTGDAELGWGAHSNTAPKGSADLICLRDGAATHLVVTQSDVTLAGKDEHEVVDPAAIFSAEPNQLTRHWRRREYAVVDNGLRLVSDTSGEYQDDLGGPEEVALNNRLDCPHPTPVATPVARP